MLHARWPSPLAAISVEATGLAEEHAWGCADLMRDRAERRLSGAAADWHYLTGRGHPGTELVAAARRIGARAILLGGPGPVTDFVRQQAADIPTVLAAGEQPPLRSRLHSGREWSGNTPDGPGNDRRWWRKPLGTFRGVRGR